MESTLLFLSTAGTAISIGVSLTPIPSMISAYKTKKLSISHLFLILNNLNSLSWALYGYKTENPAIYINNTVTTLLSLAWIFLYHQIKNDFVIYISQYIVSVLSFSLVVMNFCTPDMIGWICLIFNILGYAAPIELIPIALKEKNSKYIDIVIIGVCQMNSLIWFTYGQLTQNYFIIAPNLLGIFFSAFQILIYMWASGYLPHSTFAALSRYYADKN